MKKLILAFVALACAFAISSCANQSYCPGNLRCQGERGCDEDLGPYWNQSGARYVQTEDVPYRFDGQGRRSSGWRQRGRPMMNCDENPTRERRGW